MKHLRHGWFWKLRGPSFSALFWQRYIRCPHQIMTTTLSVRARSQDSRTPTMMPRVATSTVDTTGGSGKGNSHTVTILRNQGPESGLLTSTRETRVRHCKTAMLMISGSMSSLFDENGLKAEQRERTFSNYSKKRIRTTSGLLHSSVAKNNPVGRCQTEIWVLTRAVSPWCQHTDHAQTDRGRGSWCLDSGSMVSCFAGNLTQGHNSAIVMQL